MVYFPGEVQYNLKAVKSTMSNKELVESKHT